MKRVRRKMRTPTPRNVFEDAVSTVGARRLARAARARPDRVWNRHRRGGFARCEVNGERHDVVERGQAGARNRHQRRRGHAGAGLRRRNHGDRDSPDGSKAVTLVMFTEGRTFVTLKFDVAPATRSRRRWRPKSRSHNARTGRSRPLDLISVALAVNQRQRGVSAAHRLYRRRRHRSAPTWCAGWIACSGETGWWVLRGTTTFTTTADVWRASEWRPTARGAHSSLASPNRVVQYSSGAAPMRG